MTPFQSIYFILLNGGVIHINEIRIRYDERSEKFVYIHDRKIRSFETLEELSLYIAFTNATYEFVKRDIDKRFEWYVINNIDNVCGVFYRKKDAILFCIKSSEDKRLVKRITKISKGIYHYEGKMKDSNFFFYIGLKEELIKNGFGDIISTYTNDQREGIIKKLF